MWHLESSVNRLLTIITPLSFWQNTVDKLIKKTNLALLVGTNSWRDQFIEAITVSAGKTSGWMCVCLSV